MAATCLASAWSYGGRYLGDDYYMHWAAAQMVGADGVESIYADDGPARVGQELARRVEQAPPASRVFKLAGKYPEPVISASPFLYTVLHLLVGADYDASYGWYRLFNLICTVLVFAVVGRILRFPPVATLLSIAFFTEFFEPFRSTLRTGNMSQIQLALLAGYLWMQRRSRPGWDLAGGVILGCTVLFKPNVAIVVLMLVLSRCFDRRVAKLRLELAGMAAGSAAAFAASSIAFGSVRCWSDWAGRVAGFLGDPPAVDRGNYAFANLVSSWVGFDASVALLVVLVAASAHVLWRDSPAREDRGEPPPERDVLSIGLGLAVILLSAPLAWLHYFNLTVPLALHGLRPGDSDGAPARWSPLRRVLTLAAVLSVSLYPLMLVIPLSEPRTFALLSCAGALGLFVLALVDRAPTLARDASTGS